MPQMRTPLERRFWSKVDVCGSCECWPWQASRHKQGYGWFRYQGRMHLAHRIAYMLSTSADPADAVILHVCDNPECCNPAHLRAGTQQDNIADMDAKGRRPAGEFAPQAKLTNSQAQDIRRLYRQGRYNQPQLARLFGVDASQVSRIITGQAYRI